MGDDDNTVADFLGFLNVGCHLFLVEGIDYIGVFAGCQTAVGTISIVQKRNGDIIDRYGFNGVAVRFGGIGPNYSDLRVIGGPVVQFALDHIQPHIIHMVGGCADDVKAGGHNGISHFLRCGKRRITADLIVVICQNSLLIDESQVCILYIGRNMFINVIVIPGARFCLSGFTQGCVEQIVTDGHNVGSGHFRFLFCLGFGLLRLSFFFCRPGDQYTVCLVKTKTENDQHGDRTDEADL